MYSGIEFEKGRREARKLINIMKFTEGAFRDWGYALAKREFRDQIVSEDDLWAEHGGKLPAGGSWCM